ncbi:MAG: Ppx/GppA family phosphatase [Alphaproteobacteria bacterium]|nr:MAG: Ppx/GppA family phosphatase [Alphaproteobacteria bacterium]
MIAHASHAKLRRDSPRASGPDSSRPSQPVLAALDLGTNSCRLLVAVPRSPQPEQSPFLVVDSFSRVVRLGEGLSTFPALNAEAMDRTMEVLRICRDKMGRAKVTHLRAVATEACRQASNGLAFLERVRRETGIGFEIISGAEEARLAMIGCAPLLLPKPLHAVMFDIGGGSTELAWLRVESSSAPPRLLDHVSLPVGVVNLTERYGGDTISSEHYQDMIDSVRAALLPFDRRNGIGMQMKAQQVQILGCSGSLTTLAAAMIGLPRYQRSAVDGRILATDETLRMTRRLCSLTRDERNRIPGIGPDRGDLIVSGCAILEALLSLWPVERLRVGDRGLREGILTDIVYALEVKSRRALA